MDLGTEIERARGDDGVLNGEGLASGHLEGRSYDMKNPLLQFNDQNSNSRGHAIMLINHSHSVTSNITLLHLDDSFSNINYLVYAITSTFQLAPFDTHKSL